MKKMMRLTTMSLKKGAKMTAVLMKTLRSLAVILTPHKLPLFKQHRLRFRMHPQQPAQVPIPAPAVLSIMLLPQQRLSALGPADEGFILICVG